MNDDVVLDDAFEIKDESFIDRHSDNEDGGDDDDEDVIESFEIERESVSSEPVETTIEKRIPLSSSSTSEKREKKKRKFEELRAQKSTKKQETRTEPATLSKGGMVDVLKANAPRDSERSLNLKTSNFLDIEEIKSDGNSSAETSSSSKYVQAMLAGFSSLKKSLKIENIEEVGSPRVLIVCSSASKATEIIKEVSTFLKCKIAKLYAKHFKVRSFLM
jgi:hypothetical protein